MATSSKPGASANAQDVYNALRAKGYSTAAAAGAVGNLQQESSVNPGSVQQGGAGRGIAQWGVGARWATENQYATSKKEDPWSLTTETNFMLQEMNQYGLGPSSAFARSTNVSAATQTFESTYEKAGTVDESQRAGYAQNAYAAFSGNKVGAVTNTPASTAPGKKAAPQNPILGGLGTAGDAIGGAASDVGGAVAGGAGDLWNGAQSAAGDVSSVPKAVAKVTTTLFSVSFWIRVAFIIAGAGLVFIGTKALLTGQAPNLPGLNDKGAPSATPPAKKAPSPIGKAIKTDVEAVAA